MSGSLRLRRLGWGSVAIGLVAGLGFALPPAAAALASPGGLDSNHPNATTSILTWGAARGAAQYDVEVDDDPGFGSPEFSQRTTNTSVVPTVALPPGRNHWRVRSVSSGGGTSSWSFNRLDAVDIGVPAPVSPSDGEILPQPSRPPLLTWSAVQGASSYTVEVDGDADFVGSSTYQTESTSFVIPEPLEGGDWFWRVTATTGPGLVSKPSTTSSFEIQPLPAPELLSPSNSSTEKVEDVVLDWKPVPGAKSYEVEVALNDTFTTIIERRTGILGTRYSPPNGYNNDQYYWRVRAIDLDGKPTPYAESQFNFQRHWPDRPWPVSPIQDGFPTTPDSANHDPYAYPLERVTTPAPYLQWTPVQHASHYELEIDTQENFSSPNFESCRIGGTTYTPGNGVYKSTTFSRSADEQCLVKEGVQLFWRVRPMDKPFRDTGFAEGIEGIYSPTQRFIWDPEYFTDLSPVNDEVVDVPTMSWTPQVAAEKYKVELFKRGSSSPFHTKTTYATSYTPVNVRLNPEDGPFTWRLTAIEAGGNSSALISNTFNLSGDVPSSGAAPLTALSGRASDPATVRAPSLTWEPVPAADYYRVAMGDADTGFFWIPVSDESLGSKLYYPALTETGKRILRPGGYDWQVQAFDADHNLLQTSGLSRLRIAGFPEVTGQQVALDGTILDAGEGCYERLDDSNSYCDSVPATPVLSWDHQPGMSSYVVYVSLDANFTNLVEPTRIPNTSNTRYAPTFSNPISALPDNQSGVPYYWHIRPCKAIGFCGPDPVSSASSRAENAFLKNSPKVHLTQPAAGQAVGTNEVTFAWEDYFDTNQGTTWVSEKSPQSAQQYRLQVDNSLSFSSPLIDDIKVDQTTYTSFGKLYPEGTLYWRVAAIDVEENELNWSEPREFVKDSPEAGLVSPVGGTHVAGTTAFRWGSLPFAESYRIEVYRNNDTTFSIANRVFYKDVKTAAYAHHTPLPANAKPYVWRVRRTDAARNPGRWSAVGRFYSTGAAPMRVTPHDKALVTNNRSLFEWTEVPGAVDYFVELRQEGTTYSRYRETTVATAWAPTSTVSDGTWKWRVTARDSDRKSLGVSDWGSFRVDGSQPMVSSYSPTYSAKPKANVKAVFSEPVRRKSVNRKTFQVRMKGRKKPLAGKVSTSRDGMRAIFNPKRKLRRGRTYNVVLKSAIRDRNGNRLEVKKWSFTVR